MVRVLLALSLVLGGCSSLFPEPTLTPWPVLPEVECQIPDDDCDLAVEWGARALQSQGLSAPARMVVNPGRSRAGVLHAEVHSCWDDGRYMLVDVVDTDDQLPTATVRDAGWDDPPCD